MVGLKGAPDVSFEMPLLLSYILQKLHLNQRNKSNIALKFQASF